MTENGVFKFTLYFLGPRGEPSMGVRLEAGSGRTGFRTIKERDSCNLFQSKWVRENKLSVNLAERFMKRKNQSWSLPCKNCLPLAR